MSDLGPLIDHKSEYEWSIYFADLGPMIGN
jgi:hypothetical protein